MLRDIKVWAGHALAAGHPQGVSLHLFGVLEPGTRKGCPYISHFWELYGVIKTFEGADFTGLLWMLFLGICERRDGRQSS